MRNINWDLLVRYLTSVWSAAEQKPLDGPVDGTAPDPTLLEVARRAVAQADRQAGEGRKDEILTSIITQPQDTAASKRRAVSGAESETPPRHYHPLRSRYRWRFAISGVAVVAIAVLFVERASKQQKEAARSVAAFKTSTAPRGQRASLGLPDGTRVMLGPATTLRRAVEFARGPREVWVEGEAYFEVVHDGRRPFVVRAGDLVATDIGTAFAVRTYPEDAHARVVVREGKVAFRAAAGDTVPERLLGAGEQGRLASNGELVTSAVDTASAFAWTEGRLVIDDLPLREALPQLSRWYDLDFRLADSSLGNIRLAATLKNQPTADALKVLALGLGVRAVQQGSVVTFYRAGPNR